MLKQGGSLFESSGEELSSLSQATGRAANPTSPLGAKLLGANKDQVKMTGSSANVGAALNASVSGDLSLRDTVRQEQASKETSSVEKERKAKEEELAKLKGTLDGRVQQIAEQKLGGQTGFELKPQANAAKVATLFPSLDPAGQGAMTASINKLLTDPSDLESAQAVAKGLGMNTTNLSAEQMLAKVQETLDLEKDSLTGLAEGVDDTIKMSDVFSTPEAIAALGDPKLIAESLGLSDADFENLDVPALKAKMEELGLKDFNEVAELQRRAADPYTTESERSAISKELRRLGASGIRGTEEDYQKLEDEVNSAETVEVNGQSYSTAELLSDDVISSLISDYLLDPEAAKKMAGSPLAEFIERNKKVLLQASNNLSGAAKAYSEVNAANRELAKSTSGAPIPDSVMATLFPTWGQLGSSKIDPTTSAEYQKFKALPAPTQDALISNLGGVKNPDVVKAVLGSDPSTLQALTASGGLGSWISFRNKYDDAQKLEPVAAVTQLLGTNPEAFKTALSEYRNAQKMGLVRSDFNPVIAGLLDANNDGVLDDPAVMKAAILQKYAGVAGKLPGDISGVPNPQADLNKLNELSGNTTGVYGIIKKYANAHGAFDIADAKDLVASGATSDTDLQQLLESPVPTALAKTQIIRELDKRADSKIESQFNAAMGQEIQRSKEVADMQKDAYSAWEKPAVMNPTALKHAANRAMSVENGYFDSMRAVVSGMLPSTKNGSPSEKAAAARQITKLLASIPGDKTLRKLNVSEFTGKILAGQSWDKALVESSTRYKYGAFN